MDFEEVAPGAYIAASGILATLYQRQGDIDQAQQYYRRALDAKPASPQIHLQYGLMFLNKPLRNFEVASAHILLASVFWPESDMAWMTFGLASAERKRYSLAYSSLMEAVRINPQNADAGSALDRLRGLLDPDSRNPVPPKVSLEKYPSGAPSKVVQLRPDAAGQYIPNGIWTEWYESGELKRFVDYAKGAPHGVEITWGPDGEVLSRIQYRHGKRTRPASGSHEAGSG
jgi:tetratricopeptide (TPR) repeat protein